MVRQLHKPLLIIQSKRDQAVHPSCVAELERLAMNTTRRTLHWLEQPGHVITTDAEYDTVYYLSTTVDAAMSAQS